MTNLYPSSSKNHSCDSAVDSLMRTIRTNDSTLKIGADICERLAEQGSQINKFTNNLVEIDHKMEKCDTTVGEMNSTTGLGFWHAAKKLFSKSPKVKDIVVSKQSEQPNLKKSFSFKKKKKDSSQERPNPKSLPSTRDQIETALDIIDSQIKQIKEMGMQIGHELNHHNQMLDTATRATDIITSNIKKVEEEAEEIT